MLSLDMERHDVSHLVYGSSSEFSGIPAHTVSSEPQCTVDEPDLRAVGNKLARAASQFSRLLTSSIQIYLDICTRQYLERWKLGIPIDYSIDQFPAARK
jgi:hypothetical protein